MNALRVIGRMPLDSFSRPNQQALFRTLLLMDKRIGFRHTVLSPTGKTVEILLLLRRAIIRLLPKVSKFVIHVPFVTDVAYLKEDDGLTLDSLRTAISLFDEYPSEELYLTTVEFIDEYLGYVHLPYLSNLQAAHTFLVS